MIKYVELTAPESSQFRQVKILSALVSEGSQIEIGDPLFRVKQGNQEIDLPSTAAGRVVELIALVGENISLMTPLLLLETEVAESTASAPIDNIETDNIKIDNSRSEQPKTESKAKGIHAKNENKRPRGKRNNAHIQQQNLNLDDITDTVTANTSEKAPEPIIRKPEATISKPTKSNSMNTITVPDIGADTAKVIELLVKVGDEVSVDDSIITLESDKASMDVPSPFSGVVSSISVSLDQDVSEGTVILELTSSDNQDTTKEKPAPQAPSASADNNQAATTSEQSIINISVPDIGGDTAKVIEILVTEGQTVELDDALITLESDKASMEVPCSAAGTINSINVVLDQDISEGDVIVTLKTDDANTTSQVVEEQTAPAAENKQPAKTAPAIETPPLAEQQTVNSAKSHASPSIRRFARELGVDLSLVRGSARKNRIAKTDVTQFVKGILSKTNITAPANNSSSGIPAIPDVDFTKFGEVDVQPLNRIKRLTAENLHRSWLNVPHVTHHDEANINELESFRKQLNAENAAQKEFVKLSPLAFIVKAVVNAMRAYPQFNSSLQAGGENLIYKNYFNIGIAVETPNGLVVPVIKNADTLSVSAIAREMATLAAKVRDKKLSPADMSGACFTISSLGGIGGTSFTPIVNAPEVAILGVSRSKVQPLWDGKEFQAAMMLPLSLSYDHRVIDGAEAARFSRHIAISLEDVRRLTL